MDDAFLFLDFMKNDGFSARNISQKKIHCKYVKTCREVWGSSQNTDEWGSCPDGGLKRARPPRSDPHFPGMVQMEEEFVLFFGCRDPEGERKLPNLFIYHLYCFLPVFCLDVPDKSYNVITLFCSNKLSRQSISRATDKILPQAVLKNRKEVILSSIVDYSVGLAATCRQTN